MRSNVLSGGIVQWVPIRYPFEPEKDGTSEIDGSDEECLTSSFSPLPIPQPSRARRTSDRTTRAIAIIVDRANQPSTAAVV